MDVTCVALHVMSEEVLTITGHFSGHKVSRVRKPKCCRCGKRLVVMLLAVGATFLLGFGEQGQAQAPPSATLEPVIVSSSRIPTSLAEAPESVTVITREQIDAQHPMSVIDVLRQIPGLHIDQPGGRGGVSSVYLRGSDPNFTVVLLDGIKVNDPTNSRGGSFDFSTLDPDHIERIEIIPGPLSAVYGSDAVGGVVNIVTRQGGTTPTVTIEGSGGWHGYHRAAASAQGTFGLATYALNFAYVNDGSAVKGSAFQGKNVTLKLAMPPSDFTWLQLALHYNENQSESFPDDSGGPRFATLRDVDTRDVQELSIGGELSHEFRSWGASTLQLGFFQRHEEMTSPGVSPGRRDPFGIPPNRNDNSFHRLSGVLSHRFSLFNDLKTVVGVDLQYEDGEGESVLFLAESALSGQFQLRRAVYAPFVESQYVFPFGLTVQGGVRVDIPDGFKTQVTPRIGMLYRLAGTHTSFKANWGEGFKLPSFFALGNTIVGNPRLVPETSRGFDVGIVQDFWSQRGTANVTFFRTQFFNLIDLEEGPPPRLVNRSEVTAEGVEFGFTVHPLEHLWLNGHLTYLHTDIRKTSEDLRNRPAWRGGINGRWQWRPDLVFSADLLSVGDVLDSSIPTGDRHLDEYVRVNVATTWTMTSYCRLSLAIDNLFDAEYEEAIGFPPRGITPRLTMRLTF